MSGHHGKTQQAGRRKVAAGGAWGTPSSTAYRSTPEGSSFGDIGVPARAAIPAIEALLKEPALAEEARAALRRLGVIERK
jgi:hypothetical protein